MIAVLGPQDAHLTIVEDYFDNISIRPKDLDLLISGPSVSVTTVAKLLNELRVFASHGTQITVQVIHRLMGMLGDELSNPAHTLSASILSTRGTTIRPKTVNQKNMWMLLTQILLSSALVPLVPVKHIWLWQKQCKPYKAARLTELS